jgi:hypothetical protein
MKREQLRPGRARSRVYVILRVFNLEGQIGLRIFVDPEAARLRGELNFSANQWAVEIVAR